MSDEVIPRELDSAYHPELLESLRCPEPAERPELFPAGLARRADGVLTLHGRALTDIAADAYTHTPVQLTDLADLRSRAEAWRDTFAEAFAGLAETQVHYAAKAFVTSEIARIVSAAGLGVDCASELEMRTALAAGVNPELVGLHGNAKTEGTIAAACEAGIGRIIADSLAEIERVDRVVQRLREAGKVPRDYRAPMMIRLTTGVHAGGHEFIATAHEDQKFGISLQVEADGTAPAARAARAINAADTLEFIGLHSHIGSQIMDPAGFIEALQRVMDFRHQLIADGMSVPEVDLGGGYGIAYTNADAPALAPGDIAAAMSSALREALAASGDPAPRISIEPGRTLIAPTTLSLYRVVNIKDQLISTEPARVYRRYVGVDGGMSDNIRPALYQANYTATLANRTSTAPLKSCRIVGGHCESGDILVYQVALPEDLREGDLIAVPVTGAYGAVMASNYNMFCRPGVLGLEREPQPGDFPSGGHWLLRPETAADLLRRDPGIED